MMSSKKIFVIVLIVLVIVFIVVYFLSKEKNQQQSANLQPIDSQAVVNVKKNDTSQEAFVIGKIQQNTQNQVLLDPQKDAFFNENKNFSIAYYAQDQSFFVTLLNPDIWIARVLAEQAFLEMFKLSREDACALKVSLSVPYSVNADASGKDYSLSFCSYGKPLPKK